MRLALLAATMVLAGCGGAEPAASPSQPESPPTIRLPVLVNEQATSWEIDVPVADGWEPVVEAGQPIAAITRPFGRDCVLLVQVAAAGTSTKPDPPGQRGLRNVQNGSRALAAGDERFDLRYTFGEAERLVFSGAATGPGGHLFVELAPTKSAPWLTLTAQGGTEGPGCLKRSVDSAPATVVDALRLIANDASVRYTG